MSATTTTESFRKPSTRGARRAAPIEHQHRWRIRSRLTNRQWNDFLCSVPWIWTLGAQQDFGSAPNPKFAGAPQTAFALDIRPDQVAIRGRGLHVPRGSNRPVPLFGTGRCSVLTIQSETPAWYEGLVATGGRPFDHAVRLALQLLHTIAPTKVEISTTGDEELWAATAAQAAEILDRPYHEVRPPLTVRRSLPADPGLITVEAIGATGLWRARWRDVEVMPIGPDAVVVDGRRGFVTAAAARQAAQDFAIQYDNDTAWHALSTRVVGKPTEPVH